MEKLLLSVTEAAEVLGIGRATLYELVRSGEVESITLGRRRLIPTHSLRTLVGAPAEAPTAAPVPGEQPMPAASSSRGLEGTYVVTIRRAAPGEIEPRWR